MQFQYNDDYPENFFGDAAAAGGDAAPRDPLDFPPAQPVLCARITTRVYHPLRGTVATVQNVLVRLPGASRRPSGHRRPSKRLSLVLPDAPMGDNNSSVIPDDNDNMLSSSSSSSDSDFSSDESMEQVNSGPAVAAANFSNNNEHLQEEETDECAYWIQRTVREAIYGRVLFAIVLRKRKPQQQQSLSVSSITAAPDAATSTTGGGNAVAVAEWEVTAQHCAVKEMSWQHIRRERDRLAEDPIKEVSAMQFLKEWHSRSRTSMTVAQQQQQLRSTTLEAAAASSKTNINHSADAVMASFASMLETNVMMPLDLLSDERHLYSVMPYCNGGELFELLDMNERFTEPEARYWMMQVLNVRYIVWDVVVAMAMQRYHRRFATDGLP